MQKYFFVVVFTCTILFANAQEKFTISGYVKDITNGETMGNTSIFMNDKTKIINSNNYGFYSITVPKGNYNLVATYIGFNPFVININLISDTFINILMQPKGKEIEEVIVTAKRRDGNIKNAQMGRISLPIEQIKNLPVLFGEIDILKTIQLLPGVRNSGEGSSGFYVRGGGPDQNLILLDDAVVYNSGHLFGFFSVFNSDAIKNTTLIKGGMPAQYGGRLSSVLDITMKEGNNQKFEGEGGIGLISSRLSLQGPIKKDKSSFIVSGRRTYIDALTKPFVKKGSKFEGSGYYFYDLNTKVNFKLSEKDRLYISGYFGRDVFNFNNAESKIGFDIPWGNATLSARWNHVFNKKLFGNTTAVYQDYNFSFGANQDNFKIKFASGIRDFTLKQDFDLYPFTNHKVKFGVHYIHHKFTPFVFSGSQDSVVFNPTNAQVKYAHEASAYIQNDWDVSKKIKINIGLRYSMFQQIGPFKDYIKDANGNILDSIVFKKNKELVTYGGLEPRLTTKFDINSTSSIKASASRNLQYIHLVSNSGSTLPTDLWVPSTFRVKPQISWLYAIGFFKNINNNMFETSVELYYKNMQNQIEYQEGFVPNTLEDTEKFFTFGKGWSYGSEFFINKVKGKLTGWIGYTYSHTRRKFIALNDGNTFKAKFDRRHDLSIVATYNANSHWKFSGVFVYGSGNYTTIPQRFYFVNGNLTQEYSKINSYQLPAYHRIDFSAIYNSKRNLKRKVKKELAFSVYNAYSRKNPYFIYFDQTGSINGGNLNIQGKQISIFPILPSVTMNFKF